MDQLAVMALAKQALTARLDDDVAEAHAAVQRISSEHGPEALAGAMMAWVSTALVRSGIDQDPERLTSVSFRNVDTGEYTVADDTPPPVRWSGRLMMAMLAQDEEQVRALFNSVTDEQESTLNVVTLLSMCVIAIRQGIERVRVDANGVMRNSE